MADDDTRCHLLALPAELRIRIYEYVACGTIAIRRRFLVKPTATALAATSRKVNAEYMPVLRKYTRHEANSFEARVTNFDFSKLEDFINHLAPPSDGQEREMMISITLTKYSAVKKQYDAYYHWFETHMSVSSQKAVRIQYRVEFDWDTWREKDTWKLDDILSDEHSNGISLFAECKWQAIAEAYQKAVKEAYFV